MKKGKIFTVEGSDGSGKKTQTRLLIERAKSEGYKVETLAFPNDDNFYGKLCRQYLSGKLGNLDKNHPILVCNLYACDRFESAPLINKWLTQGKNIIFDRYVESNFAHQGAVYRGRVTDIISFIKELEFKILKLPPSDLVCFLDLPVEYALNAMKKERRDMDIHKNNLFHLRKSYRIYKDLAETEKNWITTKCVDSGKRLNQEEIHERLWQTVKPNLVEYPKMFYVATPISQGMDNVTIKMIIGLLSNYGQVLNEHLKLDNVIEYENEQERSGVNIYERDMNWIDQLTNEDDKLIFLATGSSDGRGREIERLTMNIKNNKSDAKIIGLVPEGSEIKSRLLRMDSTINFVKFNNNNNLDARLNLEAILEQIL